MSRALPIALLVVACATPGPSPFGGEQRYLKVGIDPDAKLREMVEGFEARGHREIRRTRGRHFTAVGFLDPEGDPSAVRVVTVTGTALALDSWPADGERPSLAVRLLEAPRADTADADGDGFEEVFVALQYGDARSCIITYRVRDVGFVDRAATDFGPLGEDACVTAVIDLDGDGHVELLAEWSPSQLSLGRSPTVSAVLWSHRHVFTVRGPVAAVNSHYGGLAQAALARLLETRERGDVDGQCLAAAELGMIGWLQGGEEVAQAQFEEALVGLQLDPAQQRWVQRARAFFADPTAASPRQQ